VKITKPLLAAGAALALALTSATAFGQGYEEPAQPSYPESQAPSGGEVDEQTLQSFVDAYSAVQDVRRELTQELSSTQDESQARELQQKAQQQMVGAVQEAGLTPQEYNQIASQMANDQELRERVENALANR